MKFTKKRVEIDAVPWDGTAEGAVQVIDWVLANGGTASYDDADPDRPVLRIPTLEGTMDARPNWWVIRGIEGEFYPCDPSIFAKTYDFSTGVPRVTAVISKVTRVGFRRRTQYRFTVRASNGRTLAVSPETYNNREDARYSAELVTGIPVT